MTTSSLSSGTHRWRFVRSGGVDQVALETADDLRHLHELDPKLWTALNCPTTGLEFDGQTLALIDGNGDGHIGVQEVLEAVRWACATVADPQGLFAGGELPLAAIATGSEEGARLRAAAAQVLARLGKPEADRLAVADFADMTKLFAPDQFNGDGVVPVPLAAAHGLQALAEDIVATQVGAADRSGEPGVDAGLLAAFFEQADNVAAWRQRARDDAARLLPLGEASADAAAAVAAVAAKVDDFFTRCRLAAYDARAAEPLNPAPATYVALAVQALGSGSDEVAALPLAVVAADAALPLGTGVNPAWAARIDALRRLAVAPLLGARDMLTADDWATLRARLADFEAWQAERPQTPVNGLEADRLAAHLAGDGRAQLFALVERDQASDTSAATVESLRRLVHYQRDLVTLLRNFVALSDFYGRTSKAIFQAGTLYIDQRSCELVLRVNDLDAHARMAPFSHCYLIYCLCERAGEAPFHVAAALTGGSVDELMVPGRHGVLFDRQGRDWKATVTKVVEQPVSVRQAFFTPYRRVAQFVEGQIRKFGESQDKAADARAQAAVSAAPAAAGAAAPPPAFDIAKFAGIFAALGLAVGAIGTALAAALSGLFTLAWWQLPLVVAGVLLVISGPSMLLAWLKLRRRSIGPLLDANGWAVNARARINIPFGGSLTALATLPANASRSTVDPYADKKSAWPWWLALLVLAALLAWAWRQGWLG